MKNLFAGAATAAAMALASSAQATLYQLQVGTIYGFTEPSATYSVPTFSFGPDTGFVLVTNTGTTSWTGTVGDHAVTSGGTDFSITSSALTLAVGQSVVFATSPESSNVGGFNGPQGSPQPGIQVLLNGAFSDGYTVAWSVYDSNIHSGIINGGGVTDAWVLQGGNPYGNDYGDSIETTQAPGSFIFSATSAVPEPATMAILGVGLLGLGAVRRR